MKKIFGLFAFIIIVSFFIGGCGGNPCDKLVNYYCVEKKDEKQCEYYKEKSKIMTKEDCEATLKMAK